MKLTLGHVLYIISLVWVLGMGIVLFTVDSLDMFFEQWGVGQWVGARRARKGCALICFVLVAEGTVLLARHWDRVSPLGRIRLH